MSTLEPALICLPPNRIPQLLQSYLRPDSKRSPGDPGVEPLPDNFLINGRHTFNCSVRSSTWPTPSNPDNDDEAPACTGGQLYSTKVRPGHAVRLRLINHSSYMSFWFSIDNHTVTIVEMDGVEVEPIPSRGVYVNVGQRYSVIVRADQAAGSYHMRATLPQTCFVPYCPHTSTGLESIGYEARALLSYDGSGDGDRLPVVAGVAGNTSNPHGAARNRLRGDVWEGCDDMSFDEPVPVRRRPAVRVAEGDMHSVTFQFQRAGEVNRISINRVGFPSFHACFPPPPKFSDMRIKRHPRRPTTETRSSGKPWTRTLSLAGAGTTTNGTSS